LQATIGQAGAYGLTGHHIFDSGVNIDVVIREGARAFVCGEETALNNSIEGKRAMPASKPPYPAERGLWNKPTVVNNVETLFNVPLIVKNGPEWFRSLGTESSKGTKLYTLSGRLKNYGTVEVLMGTTFREIIEGAGGGLAGKLPFKAIVLEETALNNSIEGKRAMPASKPPYPAERGLWNKPTVVNNVETLFNVPLIVKNGPEWFRSLGTESSKGTKLYTLSGRLKNYGTVEVLMGTTFREIIEGAGGGLAGKLPFKAIVLGINSGSYITAENLDARVDYESLESIGAALGSGAFVVLDQATCMVDLARYFTAFFKKESCGKCIPCREGTARMLEVMEQVTRKPSDTNSFQTLERFKGVMQLKSLASVISDTSLCSLGKSAPNPVLNTLKHFKHEFDAHIFDRKCEAGVCTDLRVYEINVDACTGCAVCFKKCPVDAIIGTPRYPHFIVQDKCIGCGTCFDVCKFNAVIIK